MKSDARAIRLGCVYALAVFGVGFVLGALRTLLIAPRTGDLAAVLIELPVILGVSWLVFGLLARSETPLSVAARTHTGLIAFLVLMALEIGLSAFIADGGVRGFFGSWRTLPFAIGMAGQAAFALIPLVHPAARN
ncbi:hypothetical protein [Hyphobacterium sp.]|uniref:hypothetical protein n=1 Tax=Hyphobacterium sp. TaxID=2004662 RepID=UPI003BACA8E3